MAIRQVNATYIPVEDRILLRVTITENDEFRFWLTRACMREFGPQVAAWLSAADNAPATVQQAFKRQAAAASADLSEPLTPGENFPLGAAPALVASLRLESDDQAARLLLQLVDKRLVTLNLDEQSLAGVQRVLQQAAAGAHWGLPSLQTTTTTIQPEKLH